MLKINIEFESLIIKRMMHWQHGKTVAAVAREKNHWQKRELVCIHSSKGEEKQGVVATRGISTLKKGFESSSRAGDNGEKWKEEGRKHGRGI